MITQRTAEWYQVRLGIPTGSNMHKLMSTLRDGSRASAWYTYQSELLAERMADIEQSNYVSSAMQWGINMEEEAIREYEIAQLERVNPGYWVDMNTWGCTPDGFVGDDGIIDVKCPLTKTFVFQRFFATEVPAEYYWQAMAALAATKRKWFDLVYYDPRFRRSDDRLFIRRIERDEDAVARMLATVEEFTAEMDERMRSIGFSWARHRFPDEAPPPVSEYQSSVAEASVDELLDLLEDHIPVEQPHLISVDGEVLPSTDQGYAQWRRGWRKAFQDLTINPHDTMGRYQPALDEALRVFASDKAKLSEIIRDVDWANGLVTQENPTLDLKL